jgi:hypothetical protein
VGDRNTTTQNATQATSGTTTTTPWGPQASYLTDAFTQAKNAYGQNMKTGAYSGDYVAQPNGQSGTAFDQAYNFGTDSTNNGRVGNLLNLSQDWLKNGTDWANQGGNGLASLAGDQTQNIIDNAGKYADNPYISGAIQAAMADANRQASESTVPNLYRSAAGSNALNSDRAALSQGVVDRGLAEMAGNLSGTMRYNAFNNGLDASASEVNARRSAYGNLGSLGQAGQGLGMTGMAQGLENQSRLNQMAAAGAEGNRMDRQYGLDNAMQQYQGKQNFPWSALNNYYNIIGNKSWGGTSNWTSNGTSNGTTVQQQEPGLASIAGGVLGAGGSMFKGGNDSAAAGIAGAAKTLFNFL